MLCDTRIKLWYSISKSIRCSLQYLSKGSLKDIQLDDVADFELTDRAMTRMGLSDVEKLAIYGIVAGVLHLGNICFEDDPASKGLHSQVKEKLCQTGYDVIIHLRS